MLQRPCHVCSTHVEMFLSCIIQSILQDRLLHACGDVSAPSVRHALIRRSAPRMWRCFPLLYPVLFIPWVCSTHVEMFPTGPIISTVRRCLLHACGDVSSAMIDSCSLITVCSTHVEMFPHLPEAGGGKESLLHACGDVSVHYPLSGFCGESAPRMWRCFYQVPSEAFQQSVCSTHVEMFLF